MRSLSSTVGVVAFVARSPVHFLHTFRSRWRELIILGVVALVVHIAFRELSAWLGLQAGEAPNPDWITDYLGAFSLLTNSGVVGVTAISVVGQFAKALLILTGLALVAMLTGVLTDGFSASVQQERSDEQANAGATALREAFDLQPTINERQLLVELGLGPLPRRFLPLNTLLTRVGMSLDEVLLVSRKHPEFRLREVREQKQSTATTLVVEWSMFGHDGICGARRACPDGSHRIHVVSTQNAGDAYIGHFSACLASFLKAGYLGNERFSSGSPRHAERLNLSKNDAYHTVAPPKLPNDPALAGAVTQFMGDLRQAVKPGDLVLVLTTSKESAATVNCATEARSPANPAEQIDLLRGTASAEQFCALLREGIARFPGEKGDPQWKCQPATGLYVTKNATELEQWLYADRGARVVTLHISMSLLRWGSSPIYFRMIHAIGVAVRAILDGAAPVREDGSASG